MLSDLQLVYMVPRNSTELLKINTTKFQVEREPVYPTPKHVKISLTPQQGKINPHMHRLKNVSTIRPLSKRIQIPIADNIMHSKAPYPDVILITNRKSFTNNRTVEKVIEHTLSFQFLKNIPLPLFSFDPFLFFLASSIFHFKNIIISTCWGGGGGGQVSTPTL